MDVEPTSMPSSTALLVHERRKKRIAAVGAIAVLGLVGGGGYMAIASMGDGMAEVSTSFNALNTCMVGEPLAEGETVAVRMSGIELAVHGMSTAERAERSADWPFECAVHAHKLAEAATSTGKTDKLAEAAEKLATELEQNRTDMPTVPYDTLMSAADALSLKATIDADVRQPPKPKPRPSVDTLPEAARLSQDGFNPGHLHVEPFQSRDVYFLMDEENLPGGPQLCDFRPTENILMCKSLPKRVAKHSPHLRLWGTTEPGGAPFLYVGDRGKDGIYRSSDGKRIGKKLIYGANAKANGNLVATLWDVDDQELKLAELRRGEKNPTTEKLLSYEESGNPYYHTGLFWDWFVYRDFDDKTKDLHLYARKIEGVGRWGKRIDVGPILEPSKVLDNDTPHLDACRDGDTIVVRARGVQRDRLAFFDGKTWHKPVPSVGIAGDLTCHAGEAVITQKGGAKHTWQNRCTPKGCDRLDFSLYQTLRDRVPLRPTSEDPVEVAEVGGNLAVVWRAPKDGLRLIVGRADAIDKDAGQLVMDQNIADGKLSMTPTVLHYRLLAGRGYALLVTSTIRGNYVHRIDPDGKVTAVTVKRES